MQGAHDSHPGGGAGCLRTRRALGAALPSELGPLGRVQGVPTQEHPGGPDRRGGPGTAHLPGWGQLGQWAEGTLHPRALAGPLGPILRI